MDDTFARDWRVDLGELQADTTALSDLKGPSFDRLLFESTLHVVALSIDLGRRAIELREQGLDSDMKTDGTPVSNADIELSQRFVESLPSIVPGPVISEENIASQDLTDFRSDQFWWLIDPLDGSRSYLDGYPDFCLMSALIKDGQAYASVVAGPAIPVVYFAVAGIGAFRLDVKQMTAKRISSQPPPDEDLSVAIFYGMSEGEIDRIRHGLRENSPVPQNFVPEAAGLKYCYVAEGQYVAAAGASGQHIWDLIPALILAEAGGALVSPAGELFFDPSRTFVERPVALAKGIRFDAPLSAE